MASRFRRHFALLVIFCLLADHTTWCAMKAWPPCPFHTTEVMTTEALSARLAFTSRRIMGRRPFLKDLLSLLGTSLWTAWFAGCSGGSQVAPPPPPPPPAPLSAIWAND